MPERRGLGRGLEVLLGGAATVELAELPVDAIHPNPRQPRKRFDAEAGHGLADSVRAQGVVQPILVRPREAKVQAETEPRGRAIISSVRIGPPMWVPSSA